MTPRTKDQLRRAAQWAALLLPALGGAWSVARAVGSTKLDVTRFVADSALVSQRDSAWKSGVVDGLHDLKVSVDSANLRLRQIVCGQKTDAGCR